MELNNNKRGSLKNLQNQRTDFDKEAMWAVLNQEKKKRRFPIWLWMGGAGLALAAIGWIWFANLEGNPTTEVVENAKQITPIAEVNSEPTPEASSGQVFVENEIESTEKIQIEKAQVATSTETKIDTPSGNEVADRRNEKIEKVPRTIPPIGSASVATATTNHFETIQNHFTKVADKEVINVSESIDYETKTEKEEEITQRDLQEEFAFLPFGKSQLLPLDFNPGVPNTIKQRRKESGFKIGVFGGYGTHFNTFGGKGDNLNSDAIIFRKENESPLDNFTAGVLIEKNIFKRFSLKTGLEWTQLNDKVVIASNRFGHVNDFNSQEIPAEFRGRSGFLKANDNQIFYNQIRQLNLPLTLAYELPIGRFSIKPEAGVIFNLTNNASGDLLTGEYPTTDLDFYYKKNVGMSYRLGLESGFHLTNHTKVFVNPIYTLGNSDWTNGMTGVSHGVSQIRLDLGLVRRF